MPGIGDHELPCGRPLRKAFDALGLLAAAGPVPLSELARRSDMPKSSAHRLVRVLVDAGLAERTERGYRLGDRVQELTRDSDRARAERLRLPLSPHLTHLRRVTGGVVALGVLSGPDVRCVDVQHEHRHAALLHHIPRVVPSCRTALGRVLLAHRPGAPVELEAVRARGFAVVGGEFDAEVTGVAAPLVVDEREPYLAIGVWGPSRGLNVPAAAVELRRIARAVRSDFEGGGPCWNHRGRTTRPAVP